jgi:CheY-like chemotaxis protein
VRPAGRNRGEPPPGHPSAPLAGLPLDHRLHLKYPRRCVDPSEVTARPSTPPESAPFVLCIEDDPANMRLMRVILHQRPSLRLVTAETGRLGLAMAREHRPDVILLDLRLPDISGEDVLAALRQDPELRLTPVLVVSAHAHADTIARVLAAGAQAYITKPIDIADLLAQLDATLLKSRCGA